MAEEEAVEVAEGEVVAEAAAAEGAAEEEEEVHPADSLPLRPQPLHQAHPTTEED